MKTPLQKKVTRKAGQSNRHSKKKDVPEQPAQDTSKNTNPAGIA